MSENEEKYITPELILDPKIQEEKKKYYQNIYKSLPPMITDSLNITGFKLEKNSLGNIIADVFVRSTLPKAVYIEGYPIVLLDKDYEVVAKKTEKFEGLDELTPNTAKLWKIEFSKEDIKQYNFKKLEKWSIAFAENLQHRLDLSDLDESKISNETKEFLKEVIEKKDIKRDELTFTGLSVQGTDTKQLNATVLISNGTKENLKIKQLPLKLYDAKNDLVAKGTFKMGNLIIQANTSKPISIVFPATSILKEDIDLTSWSITHQQ